MKRGMPISPILIVAALLLAMFSLSSASLANGTSGRLGCFLFYSCDAVDDEADEPEEFSETKAIIEINASDGDVGFHARFDGGAWDRVMMFDPDGEAILDEMAVGSLADQGVTENFFESAEPLCEPDPEEPDEEVVTLAEFLERFPQGEYEFGGTTIDGDDLVGAAELTYDLPAAPDISMTDEMEFEFDEDNPIVIMWGPGSDLGEKCHDQSLVDDGTITDPALVEVVGWEVVVEPDDDEGIEPLRVISIQLPPHMMSLTLPYEWVQSYIDLNDVTEFKFEVGAIEASGNQTFSEGVFAIAGGDEDDGGDEGA